MKPWTAPLIIATITIPTSFLLGEPAAALIWTGVALSGYALNKNAN
jgi:hypothetical protein